MLFSLVMPVLVHIDPYSRVVPTHAHSRFICFGDASILPSLRRVFCKYLLKDLKQLNVARYVGCRSGDTTVKWPQCSVMYRSARYVRRFSFNCHRMPLSATSQNAGWSIKWEGSWVQYWLHIYLSIYLSIYLYVRI